MVQYTSTPAARRHMHSDSRASRWGRLDYSLFSRQHLGRATARLIVLRPGVTNVERFWVSVWGWLIHRELWLAPATLAAVFAGASLTAIPLFARLGLAAAALIVVWIGWWMLVRRTLVDARGVRVHVRAGGRAIGDMSRMQLAIARLDHLDSLRGLTPVEYEARWAEIYEWLGADRVVSGDRQ